MDERESQILRPFASVVNHDALTQPQRGRGTEALVSAGSHLHNSAKSHIIKQPYRKYSMSIAGWYDKPGFAINSTNRPPFDG